MTLLHWLGLAALVVMALLVAEALRSFAGDDGSAAVRRGLDERWQGSRYRLPAICADCDAPTLMLPDGRCSACGGGSIMRVRSR